MDWRGRALVVSSVRDALLPFIQFIIRVQSLPASNGRLAKAQGVSVKRFDQESGAMLEISLEEMLSHVHIQAIH